MNSIPKLPDKINQILLFLAPIYAGILGIVGFLGFVVIGSLTFQSQVGLSQLFEAINVKTGNPMGAVSILLGLVLGLILFISVPKLIKRQLMGWNLLMVSVVIRFLANILFNLGSNIDIWGIGEALVALYLVAQLRSYYK